MLILPTPPAPPAPTPSANILLDSHLVPRLSDFGLARECTTRSTQRSTYSTKSEVIMGTVAYMAPEFFRNRKLSPKMDVYSFGVVLLELYTGLAADDPTVAPASPGENTLCCAKPAINLPPPPSLPPPSSLPPSPPSLSPSPD